MTHSLPRFCRHFTFLAVFLAAIGATACGGADAPTTLELHGMWHNEDAGTHRVFVFASADDTRPELSGRDNVFLFYYYNAGQAPVLIQTGSYEVAERLVVDAGEEVMTDTLVMRIAWDETGSYAGQEFGNPIGDFDGDTFVLRNTSGANGLRVFRSVDALP